MASRIIFFSKPGNSQKKILPKQKRHPVIGAIEKRAKIIEEGKNIQWDPEFASIFVELMKEPANKKGCFRKGCC